MVGGGVHPTGLCAAWLQGFTYHLWMAQQSLLAGTWRDDTAPPLPLLTDPSFKGYRVHMLLVITIVLLIFCFYFNQRVSEPDGSGP